MDFTLSNGKRRDMRRKKVLILYKHCKSHTEYIIYLIKLIVFSSKNADKS